VTPRLDLPAGVRVLELATHRDERGSFTELYRAEWETGVAPVQWNAVHSIAGTLRGVHVHLRHEDYLTVAQGRLLLGLCDLRRGARRRGVLLDLEAGRRAVAIPAGVAHGFYFPEASVHVYAVSRYWDPDDELGCRWDDAALGVPWPSTTVLLSDRDRALPSLPELLDRLHAREPARFEKGTA
jgi:dTDP-4-dehydrorhamnose 3,5-epimerase